MNRIQKTFARVKTENRAALIPFIMGYDPDAKTTAALLNALPKAGADIIEIGVPFSEPMADGPTIQAAGLRALKAGASLKNILQLVKDFRKKNNGTPIILMGYYNPIYCYGGEKFCADAAKAGVDGLIIVDLPPEEEQELRPFIDASRLDLIRLIAPTSEPRLELLSKSASGFVYYISMAGVTGTKSIATGSLKAKVAGIRRHTKLPIAVGFGIKTPRHVRDVAKIADAVVVGSALVKIIADNKKNRVAAAVKFVSGLARAL